MKIFYSGGTGLVATPEALIPEKKPKVMLTFYDIKKSGTASRLKSFLHQTPRDNGSKKKRT